ncbi:hypothetical protein QBC36DRAFT_374012 [Triangularia setosa]|uniref:DUF6546 domain-containing protein n=1 Tax=Triangularia setosa TaxID=2587417 RepID=A0AAN7AD96_9PEZI|nr:hypothetical protein QBC36DRAFT_374012 [Podospora setosa]
MSGFLSSFRNMIACDARDLRLKWEPSRGLEVDINVHLPSDLEHSFRYTRVDPDIRPGLTRLFTQMYSDPWKATRPSVLRKVPSIPAITSLRIHYEPWRLLEGLHSMATDDNLDRVVVFSEFNEDYDAARRAEIHSWSMSTSRQPNFRTASPKTGQAFAKRYRNPIRLSLSFTSDANDFFRACLPD